MTGSWDKTARVWNIYSKREEIEVLEHGSEVLSIALSPDSKRLYTASLGGQISIWILEDGNLFGTIDCQRDVWGGRMAADKIPAAKLARNKHFTSICASPTGEYVLACGNSRYACLYDARQKILLRRFVLTNNRSLDGVLMKLNSGKMTEFGNKDDVDAAPSGSEDEGEETLPGAKKPASVKRTTKLAIRGKCVRMAADGKSFACATTEGVMLFSVNEAEHFAPYKLSVDVTLNSAIELHNAGRFVDALVVALKLDYKQLVETIYHNVKSRIENFVHRSRSRTRR